MNMASEGVDLRQSSSAASWVVVSLCAALSYIASPVFCGHWHDQPDVSGVAIALTLSLPLTFFAFALLSIAAGRTSPEDWGIHVDRGLYYEVIICGVLGLLTAVSVEWSASLEGLTILFPVLLSVSAAVMVLVARLSSLVLRLCDRLMSSPGRRRAATFGITLAIAFAVFFVAILGCLPLEWKTLLLAGLFAYAFADRRGILVPIVFATYAAQLESDASAIARLGTIVLSLALFFSLAFAARRLERRG
jgi:hypothetical protein